MRAILFFFIKLAIVIAAAIWLVERPGRVSVEWLGYRIDSSVGVLLLAVFLLMIAGTLLYRFLATLRRAPGSIRQGLRDGRRERGYLALTQGMVAVAAGDPEEARKLATRANRLLDEPPLTLLLSAQAAQLNGDEAAAERYFLAMLEREETAFLGLRGLVNQALKAGDEDKALRYTRQARDLRPETPWVAQTLFDLELRHGRLEGAAEALALVKSSNALSHAEWKRRRAVLLTEEGRTLLAAGKNDEAAAKLREANRLAPTLTPAAALLAQAWVALDSKRKAQRLLKKSWTLAPHPSLLEPFFDLAPGEAPLARVRRLEKLISGQPDHIVSHMSAARAALDAELWGEARRHLEKAAQLETTESVCRLMAELEEAEHGNSAAARQWFQRASGAAADPTWVCSNCGAATSDWGAHCRACGSIDSLDWRAPAFVGGSLLQPLESDDEAVDESGEEETGATRRNSTAKPVLPLAAGRSAG
ncbi:heme biosynthesis HemY N-terminal domain-containing protein [Limibacillus sp. MBR-115]|jgi:HemY protein|uniref:heme biosynthesis protein HemY n=1 Tax=Limibacillus sp. MBR-115 TaxID=3156465 RepID=UPI0033909CC8